MFVDHHPGHNRRSLRDYGRLLPYRQCRSLAHLNRLTFEHGGKVSLTSIQSRAYKRFKMVQLMEIDMPRSVI